MPTPAFFYKARREPFRGPQLTPAEYQESVSQLEQTVHTFEERQPQSQVLCRPSKNQVAFFLSPVDMYSCPDFIIPKERFGQPFRATPRGREMLLDDRRNIQRPDTVAYGDLVGASDGYAPYGLD